MRFHSIQASYSARISAVRALEAAAGLAHGCSAQLRAAAASLELQSATLAPASVSRAHGAFADLLGLLAYLADWHDATVDAEIDSDRHARAARARSEQWLNEYKDDPAAAQWVGVAEDISCISAIREVSGIACKIKKEPLPVAVRAARHSAVVPRRPREELIEPPRPELEIAFLRFRIDEEEAEATHFLQPGVLHDIEVEVRVSRWPEGAGELILTPVTVESRESYDLPTFRVKRDSVEDQQVFHERGRALLRFPQSFGARPYEFKYGARFEPSGVEQPVSVVGQRTLRLEGVDVAKAPATGYAGVDRRLLYLRDQLRRRPGVTQDEIRTVMTLMPTIGSVAARGLQDGLFSQVRDEADFQRWLRDELRRNPAIGPRLEEHPHVGGGIADLSLHGIRIELKFEGVTPLQLSDCEQFVAQTQHYAAASGSRIGILCVLDNSPKRTAPFAPEDGIGVFAKSEGSSSLTIVALLQGNTPRPSDLSRRKTAAAEGGGGWID